MRFLARDTVTDKKSSLEMGCKIINMWKSLTTKIIVLEKKLYYKRMQIMTAYVKY